MLSASDTIVAGWFGRVGYDDGLALQADVHTRRRAGEVTDTLLHLEHPHVYSIGRRGSRDQIIWDDAELERRGVIAREADRGGMVTYHGPGQLVGYPIIALGIRGDVIGYLRDLEEALIRTLSRFGVDASRSEGDAGVWVGDQKIAAIGVRVTRGVTKHGYALNVSPDLDYFGGIVPCGITDRGVTSIQKLTGDTLAVEEVGSVVARELADVLRRRLEVAA